MATNTTKAVLRSKGGSSVATPAPTVLSLKVTVDPTASSAGTGKYLPANAVPINVLGAGGSTGGTNPTIDVGVSGDGDAFANELVSDAFSDAVQATTGGASLGVKLTADTEIYAGVGASAATGGTTTFYVMFIMDDDGVTNS